MHFCPERLIQVRESLHINKAEAARRLNLSAMAYGRYEPGEREPSYQYAFYIAYTFHCNLDFLYGQSDEMETDLSEYHKGTDGLYYADYIAPNKAETFIGKLVSTEWWHHRGQFALICNFRTEDRRRIALFAFQKHTGFYGPRYGNVNFKTVEKGTLWQCEIQMTRTRRCTWARARQIKK